MVGSLFDDSYSHHESAAIDDTITFVESLLERGDEVNLWKSGGSRRVVTASSYHALIGSSKCLTPETAITKWRQFATKKMLSLFYDIPRRNYLRNLPTILHDEITSVTCPSSSASRFTLSPAKQHTVYSKSKLSGTWNRNRFFLRSFGSILFRDMLQLFHSTFHNHSEVAAVLIVKES